MNVTAPTEAQRLNLYHLSSLFFHSRAEDYKVILDARESVFRVTLKNKEKSAVGEAQVNLPLHKEKGRGESVALAQAFARAAKAFTSYVPPYGLLFGVRPVKVPVFYRKLGHSKEETRNLLMDEFLVSEEKASLLLQLAETELSFEAGFGKEDAMLYLSIPFCPSRCRYCSFISSAAPDHLAMIPDYLSLLQEEIRQTAALFQKAGRKPRAVYMGGGTPGILSAEQLKDTLTVVKDHFDLSGLQEFCVELGRPDTVTEEKLLVLKELGAERISINPQTTKDQTLRRIGRGHTAEEFYRAMDLANKIGFASVNCDLIAGLEGESPEDFLTSLEKVLSFSPSDVTVHALCRKRSAEGMEAPTELYRWQEAVLQAHKACIKKGLDPYYLYRQKNTVADLENVGFAKKGSLCIYNLAMMEDLCDIFACGAGGIGKLLPKEKGGRIQRFAAYKYPFEYLSRPERVAERLQEMSSHL